MNRAASGASHIEKRIREVLPFDGRADPRLPRPREVKQTVRYLSRTFAVLLLATLVATPGSALADNIDRLASTLRQSKSDKARISAAVALSKSKDTRAVPALAYALRDRSKAVRAIAASGLGMLGDRRALKALRQAARDKDDLVRRKAIAAIRRIENNHKSSLPTRSRTRRSRLAKYSIDAKESPLVPPRRPTMHVRLKSAADKTPGKIRQRVRKERAEQMKSMMMKEMVDTKTITTRTAVASALGLRSYSVDLSLLKLDRVIRGSMIEIECEIRLTISNDRGKMISFLTGGAKVQVPTRAYRRRYEPQMRKEALENAVRKMYLDLLRFLRSHRA